MKNILIVGGSGFVGSRLMLDFPHYQYQNLDKKESPFFSNKTTLGNILNKDDLTFRNNINTVVLLAAEHKDNVHPSKLYYDVNVQGTKNVLKAMDNAGIKNLIFTSSVAIYGLNKTNPKESHFEDPFNHYGKSKWQAEQAIKNWYSEDPQRKSVTIIRPTVIFGERNRGNVYNLLKQISSKKFIIIGKGQNKKSMAYVGNVVAFINNRLEKNDVGYHIFNYIDKPDFSMTELVSVIENKMGITIPKQKIPYWLGILVGYGFDILSFILRKKFLISSIRIKKFCSTTQFDASKLHSVFKPTYSLEEGLKRTLDHDFLNQKDDDILFFSK